MRTLDDLLIDAGLALDDRSAGTAGRDEMGRSTRSTNRWIAVTGASVLVAASVVVFVAHRHNVTTPSAAPSASAAAPQVSTDGTATTDATQPSASLARTVGAGSTGDDVLRIEQRLHDLGFFVGDIDGTFDEQTEQAVWAWKKLADTLSWRDLERDGDRSTVSPPTWLRMTAPFEVTPRRPSGDRSTHVEVYLPQQVAVVFTADRAVFVANISSGQADDDAKPVTFCETVRIDTSYDGQPMSPPVEQALCAQSKTPGGVFSISRRLDGNRAGSLGGMYRPQYFNYGIAIHGAINVPPVPVSRGTIRVTIAAADELWKILALGEKVYVWGQDGREPEDYTREESLPSFPYPAPSP
jgi:hypothetical protein